MLNATDTHEVRRAKTSAIAEAAGHEHGAATFITDGHRSHGFARSTSSKSVRRAMERALDAAYAEAGLVTTHHTSSDIRRYASNAFSRMKKAGVYQMGMREYTYAPADALEQAARREYHVTKHADNLRLAEARIVKLMEQLTAAETDPTLASQLASNLQRALR